MSLCQKESQFHLLLLQKDTMESTSKGIGHDEATNKQNQKRMILFFW